MKKEDLIIKWLDNNLNDDEQKAFEQLDASRSYVKIDAAAQHFKAPAFDEDALFDKIKNTQNTSNTSSWKSTVMGIAAAMLIGLFAYFSVFTNNTTEHIALNGDKTEFFLPDTSEVILNAGSKITYNDENWNENRHLALDGEAYFKVTKGEKFVVSSPYKGRVTVLGTQFTVTNRSNYFEVICFEGLVQVDFGSTSRKISAGERILFYNDIVTADKTTDNTPSWTNAKSSFTSAPFGHILSELERQYNLNISAPLDVENTLFTGSFTHENLETALQAITIPLNLSYDISGDEVTLKPNPSDLNE